MPDEATYVALLCSFLGGAEPETRVTFDVYGYGRPAGIDVDCETPTHVIEIGLDERVSSRDSVHQATFAATLTEKRPWVILIDTDGSEGRYEFEMRQVTDMLGIAYTRCSAGFLESWATSAGSRRSRPYRQHDLPAEPAIAARCPLNRILEDGVWASATN
jgi:hypothetical protein